MKVKEDFFSRGSFKIGNGLETRFWEDTCLGDKPLAQQYPSLYNIAQHKNVMVASVLTGFPLNLAFRRNLSGNKWSRWLHLISRLIDINLTNDADRFVWNLTASGIFSVKSMDLGYMNDNTIFHRKYLWKIKVPLKIKIFMWFLHRKCILTKDNLLKRNWQGSKTCCFCDKDETIQHLFFECPLAKIIWRIVHIDFGIAPPKNVANLLDRKSTRLNSSHSGESRMPSSA